MKKFSMLEIEIGTCAEIAHALGVGVSIVYLWRRRDVVPVKYLRPIEKITEGRVNPKFLRPDLFGG